MPKRSRVREQHIAVFGESGSGKTVLVSSFFGPTQEGTYRNELWDLVADDTGQGNRLNQNYLGMRDRSTVPAATRFKATAYSFTVQLKGAFDAESKRQPFDALRLVWHDYPGEWFEEEPSSEEERRRRVETFFSLLRSDVAVLLVDGQKLLDHAGEEERYLKSLFANYRQGILRLKEDLLRNDDRLIEFPRIWIIALSKSDLFPDWDVYAFRDLVVGRAAADVERLHETIQGLVETPEALSVGEDFLILSSAEFEAGAGAAPRGIDVTRRVGLDLILPIAAILPLERRAMWERRMEIPRQVLDKMADGAEVIAAVLAGSSLVNRVATKVPRIGPMAKHVVLPLLVAATRVSGTKLKDLNAKARDNHDYVTATLTQFKLDLERGESDRLLLRSIR